ncbi:MAG TPA: hypothetical protein PKX80_04405 [Flexilinea sp.]|jgi:hypothetical protein|nr:hypothetical protein [Flexilinea sp.]
MKSKTNAVPIRKVITFRSNVPVPEAKITEKDTDYRGFDLFFSVRHAEVILSAAFVPEKH